MARAPGGAARRRGGRRDVGGEAVRKGPWMAEEDAVLLEHVRTHGPRDWSSIRSKGALQRTGKSCRLRWVNKLRPNLKTGCKFSADEERVVIELQAQFGNKWARIATYLPGRTDNDVKNFWSTRQKRLARLLRAPLRSRTSNTKIKSSNTKAPATSLEPASAMGSCQDHGPSMGNPSGGQCYADAPLMEYQDAARTSHDQMYSGFLSFEPLPLQAAAPATEGEASSSNAAYYQLAPESSFYHHPYHLLEFPGLPERCSVDKGFVGAGAMDDLAYQELLPPLHPAPMMMPFFGMEYARDAIKVETRDNFFDDLSPDVFDSFDQVPPPFSPSATNSEL
uniref:Transcription factor GAMYB n=1 Tax=Hordeum vulgare subsp. vulgare TaxID=112509 RepID=A0A8I6WVH2_HORVV